MTAQPSETSSASNEWLVRDFDPALDTDAFLYILGVTYARSRAGRRAGAWRAGRDGSVEQPSTVDIAKQKAFLEAHRPIWRWLFEHADVKLAVDPDAPHIIFAWLVTSGPDVIHAVGCKRSLNESGPEPGPGADIVRDLLGDRLSRHQVLTLELPQLFAHKGTDFIGIERPKTWGIDPTWLLTRMVSR